MAELAGAVLFVRYAFPPNSKGYCGPADNSSFFEYGVTGTVDAGLRAQAQAFAGAWPYLELIAGASRIPDPLDRRVVEAYWVGNGLLDRIGPQTMGGSMEERFRRRTGRQFPHLAESVVAGGMPHHSYHVFCIYPWVGLLGSDRKAGHALIVLDQCRIRWGRVLSTDGDRITVQSRPLTWDGRRLELGEPIVETATRSLHGAGFVQDLAPGDWVSLHWDWVCDRLSERQRAALARYTAHHLSIVNERVEHPGPVAALE